MTSTLDIAAKFETTIASLPPVVGPPKDDDLGNVRKVLSTTYLSIQLAGSKSGRVTRLILANAVYTTIPGINESFIKDEQPLGEYDPSITEETAPWEQRKLATIWTSRLANQRHIATTKHCCRRLILHKFEEVHDVALKDNDIFYKMVSPLALLAHIAGGVKGLKLQRPRTHRRRHTLHQNSQVLGDRPPRYALHHEEEGHLTQVRRRQPPYH